MRLELDLALGFAGLATLGREDFEAGPLGALGPAAQGIDVDVLPVVRVLGLLEERDLGRREGAVARLHQLDR
ncbi:MAG: hypothetical protein AAF196_07710 [Planctomycetota bacterium]